MNQLTSLAIALPLLLAAGWSKAAVDAADLSREFAAPPLRWQSRPLWFWNGKLNAQKTRDTVAACKSAGYYGMGILPAKGMGVDFMSPEFLKHYKVAVDEAAKLGMKMCLYDEFWFPSGSAGGLLAQKHPEALGKRLDMLATDVNGPREFSQAVPDGTLMGAVAMAKATKQRLDITASIKDGTLRWKAPAGEWKVMIFTCVRDGGGGLVDYLEPTAVDAFIKLTYQIKSFKYQSMPGIDQVFAYGRASRAYKVVSSAANNYDRPQVVTECYGGIDLPLPNLYKEAIDQFAKGINTMVPHAVWYDPAAIVYQPDISPGAPKYGPELPAYNQYIGRLQRMLQGGRHVADIGVLYPIATLQAASWFGPGKPYEGCVVVPEADYMEVGEALSLGVRRDFTFVHPEVLEQRCTVEGAAIALNNQVNHERWRAFIIPGSRCIHIATLRRIKQFYDQGGMVIATTRLPDQAAEFGADAEVRQLVSTIFGPDVALQWTIRGADGRNLFKREPTPCHRNARGGKAWFLPSPEVAALKAVLAEALPDGDVVLGQDLTVSGGNFSYIHKVKDGKSMYFFGNSSDAEVDVWVNLRGKLVLEAWNPHDGKIGPAEVEPGVGKEGPVTRVHVKLAPVRSLFLVAADTGITTK